MKRAMVTGASEGIGRAVSERLAKEGFAVTLVARNAARLKELLLELAGHSHKIVVADLSRPSGQGAARRELARNRYDILVNNAGFGVYGNFHDVDFSEYEKMMAVNMSALTALAHAFLIKARKGAALVNVSSVLGVLPLPGSAVYAASKAYVSSLSDSLWRENRTRGIHVVGICRGYTRTEFQKRAGDARRNMPALFTQTPAQVADAIWRALVRRDKPFVVSGFLNLLATLPARFLTRKMLVTTMARRG